MYSPNPHDRQRALRSASSLMGKETPVQCFLSTVRRNYAASFAGCGAPNFASRFVFVYVH